MDGLDFLEWNDNKFTNTAAWCSGDFSADGVVDGQDFLLWNFNKFTSADAAAVPEPSTGLCVAFVLAMTLLARRRRHGDA